MKFNPALKAGYLVLSALLGANAIMAQSPPSADSFVITTHPHKNYGDWPLLVV